MKFINNSPFNVEFGDIYFNTFNPIKESKFVFASKIYEILDKKDFFIVAECGFGTGLNFLNLVKIFKKTDKKLHYVAIEKNPISAKDLKEIYEKLGKFKKSSKILIKKISTIKDIFINRIKFSKNITLDLVIGDANEVLKNLDFKADIWFMDGFAPAKNPQMWSFEIFNEIARLSKTGCIVATFTSARIVKDNLEKNGFFVKKIQGFGKKREMIKAKFNAKILYKNVWFERNFNKIKGKKVLIIGAGIAGIATALELKKLGFDVTITEKENKIATNGSGNLIGALMPLITKNSVMLGKMHKIAFDFAKEFYKKSKFAHFCGAKLFAFDDNLKEKYKFYEKYSENDKPFSSLILNDCAAIEVKKLIKNLSKKLKILTNFEFLNYEKQDGKIFAKFLNNEILQTDILIFTTGSHSEELFGKGKNPKLNFDDFMQISSVRGQVTWLKPCIKTQQILNSKGYITPCFDKIQIIGATYDRIDYETKSRKIDDERNLQNIKEYLPKNYKIIGSKVGFRSYSGDRFPLIGQIHDANFYKQNYKSIFWTKNNKSDLMPENLDGIYINSAHGSRGLCTAILGAKILCDLITNRPICVEKSLINELNPARFLIRKLKKGLIV